MKIFLSLSGLLVEPEIYTLEIIHILCSRVRAEICAGADLPFVLEEETFMGQFIVDQTRLFNVV